MYTYVKINIKRTLPEEANGNALKALILWTEAKGSLVKLEKTLKLVKDKDISIPAKLY